MEIDDDKVLSLALREQEVNAFDKIFHKYFKSIYCFILHNCKSPQDAEDMTQEVFIRLWENSQTQITSLKAYLYTIARNVVIDRTRRGINKLIFEALNEEQHATLIDEESETDENEKLLSIVHHIANSMPERRLEVYKLRWVEGLSRKEIANKMGITVTTVDIHLKKGIDYLRSAVSKIKKEE